MWHSRGAGRGKKVTHIPTRLEITPFKILEPERESKFCMWICMSYICTYCSRNLLLWLINTYDGCMGWVSKQILAGAVPPPPHKQRSGTSKSCLPLSRKAVHLTCPGQPILQTQITSKKKKKKITPLRNSAQSSQVSNASIFSSPSEKERHRKENFKWHILIGLAHQKKALYQLFKLQFIQ